MSKKTDSQVIVGPRRLEDRICRLVYARSTDEVWTEEWQGGWVRTTELVRLVLQAPTPKPSQLKKRGIPVELGAWDQEEIHA